MKISIKAARVNAGLTQKQLAERMGRNPQTILNWERGNTNMTVEDFKQLCTTLGVDEDNIFLPIESS